MTKRRWRVLLAACLAVLAAGLLWRPSPAERHHVTSLVDEWWDCLRHGQPPSLQDEIRERYQRETNRLLSAHPDFVGVTVSPPAPPISPADWMAESTVDREAARRPPIVIAVIDSGVDANHPDLPAHVVLPGADFLNPCGDGRSDVSGHGTAVAGVIASATHGAAPEARILPVRTQLGTGRGSPAAVALGIAWASYQGADVISISSATHARGWSARLQRLAVWYATRRGAVVVASAGNAPDQPVGYPAALPKVIAVTSVGADSRISSFSTMLGPVDVAAPGQGMRTLNAGGGFTVLNGTSLSTPLVSAAVAELLATRPTLTREQVRYLLRSTATPVLDARVSFGVASPSAAIHALLPPPH